MKPGDIIYVLQEYDLVKAELLSIGRKNLKVHIFPYKGLSEHIRYISPDRAAEENESIAVVWELWKGINGRGGYRLERNLYSTERVPANQWGFSRYVNEEIKP